MGRRFVTDIYNQGGQYDFVDVDEDGFTSGTVQSTQEEKSILDANAQVRALRGGSIDHSKFGHHVARIPIELYEQWKRTYPELTSPDRKVRDAKLVALINDPDFKNVRTSEASGGRGTKRSGNRSFGGIG